MPEKQKTADDLEELSFLLDELNAGRSPECDNAETAELLAVADLIRKSSPNVCPPQHILDQTVDRAFAGIQASRRKPRIWWYSGALSTAAAVILVVGLNLLPSWPKQGPPITPPQPVVSQQQAVPQPNQGGEWQPAAITQDTPIERPQSTNAPQVVEKQVPSKQSPTPAVAAVPPLPALNANNAKAPETRIMAEEAPRASKSKSAYFSLSSSDEVSKSAMPSLTPLKIPEKVPDLVITDRENGTIRQIYYKGTPQEVTITQRLRPYDGSGSPTKSLAPSPENPDDKSDIFNTVRVTIADQEVTVEGRQSRELLLKLAQSLTP
jgi:hypothetical protein